MFLQMINTVKYKVLVPFRQGADNRILEKSLKNQGFASKWVVIAVKIVIARDFLV